MRRLFSIAPVPLWPITPPAFAQLLGITSQPLPGSGQNQSFPMQALVFITSLAFIPAILPMITGFTRIIIVFGPLRSTLGMPFTPSNQVLLGLALFLTFFIMSSVIDRIYADAYQPLGEEEVSTQEALEKRAQLLREFMLRQTRKTNLGLFARLVSIGPPQEPKAVLTCILLPVCATSELEIAFQIGFTVFIPLLVIGLVVANVLMVSGTTMVPPVIVALPFKLMLFVLVDGQQLLIGSLVQSSYSQRGKMTPEPVMMMGTEAMKVTLALMASLLLVALVTGLIISILQAATQINEMILSSIPKIIVVFIAIIIAGPWMLSLLLDYVHTLFINLPCIIGQPVQ